MKNVSLIIISCVFLVGWVFILCLIDKVNLYKQKLEISNVIIEEEVCIPEKYQFLNKQVYLYINELCEEKNIDKDLCISILCKENPNFNFFITNVNSNGTIDCGLWQLNDKFTYCKKGFVESYWKNDKEFDIFDWKHNTYIAISLIEDLYDYFQNVDNTIMAYNCGLGRVVNKKIPNSTKKYLKDVKKTYNMLIKE